MVLESAVESDKPALAQTHQTVLFMRKAREGCTTLAEYSVRMISKDKRWTSKESFR